MRSKRHLLLGPAIGVVALATCADPFGFDNNRQTPPGGGSVVAPPPGAPPVVPPPPVQPPAMPPPAPPSQPPPQPPGGAPPPAPVPIDPGPICNQVPAPPGADEEDEVCPDALVNTANWFPVTPPVNPCFPLPHPETECPFYEFGFQHFLIATQPKNDQIGTPDFLNWATIENTFGEGAGKPHPEGAPILAAGVTQAGQRQILVDQNRNPVYYGLHFNKVFVDFVNKYQLTTVDGIKRASPELQFPVGAVTLKSAWQLIPQGQQPNPNMIRAQVRVPTLRYVNGEVSEDHANLRIVNAQLLTIHVVYTIPGHPEFLWATFEAVDARNNSLVAPSARDLPPRFSQAPFVQNLDTGIFGQGIFALFPRGGRTTGLQVPVGQNASGVPANVFDVATQTFAQPTPVYRVYRGSLSHETDLDAAVDLINEGIKARFNDTRLPQNQQPDRAIDRRGSYSLVGAIWLDVPKKSFGTNKVLVNDPNDPGVLQDGPESPASITGGEDRLSSTAIESFTQADTSFPNCLECHNSQSSTAKGVPAQKDQGSPVLIEPKQINVSHIFNEFIRLSNLGILR
jgi:hypothetical protein